MVNVNKNIKPGVKVEPAAPKRRLRNQALNSSKKTLPDSIRSRRRQKLNCSRESVINQLVNEEQIYTQEEAEELIDSFEEQTGATVVRLATMDEVENEDGEFWATKDGKTTLWCRGNGFWYDSGSTDMNSSKKTRMNCSSIDSHILDPIYDTLYNSATAEEYAKYFEVPVEDVNELAQVVRDNGYGDVVGYLTAKPEYSDALSFNAIDGAMVLEDGTVGILVRDRFHEIVTDIELLIDNGRLPKNLDSSRNPAQRTRMNCSATTRFEKYFDKVTDQQLADFYGIDVEEIIDVNKDIENANYGKVVAHYIPKSEYAEVLVDGDWESLDILDDGTVGFSLGEGGGKATRFYGVDIDTIEERLAEAGLNSSRTSKKTRMNCSADTKITTESGNEISMGEIKVVQNPSTNELALFIPENDEDAIPEGFTVIGDVVAAGGEAENSEEADSEESEELDSSKKLNSSKRRSSKNLNSNRRRSVKKKK